MEKTRRRTSTSKVGEAFNKAKKALTRRSSSRNTSSAQDEAAVMGVKQLKIELDSRNVDYTGLTEKRELVALLVRHWNDSPAAASSSSTTTPAPWSSKTKRGGCPFSSSHGYATSTGRYDYLSAKGIDDTAATESLQASPDLRQPIYYWQLFSVLGADRIQELVRRFYTRIYADDTEGSIAWAFERISGVEHHIMTQTQFWCDSFGGGRYYHGGDFRLNFHHEHNADDVMNAAAAKRWLLHMGRALCSVDYSDLDPRVKPCIVDFLRVKVRKYASHHSWRYDESDFAFVANDPEMRALYESNPEMLAVEDRRTLRAAMATADDLPAFSVRELRALLDGKGVSHSGAVEKTDLVALAAAALEGEGGGGGEVVTP